MRGRLRPTPTPFGGHNLLGPIGSRPPTTPAASAANPNPSNTGPITFSEKLILPSPSAPPSSSSNNAAPQHTPHPPQQQPHPESSDAITLLHLSQQQAAASSDGCLNQGQPQQQQQPHGAPHAQIHNMIMQHQSPHGGAPAAANTAPRDPSSFDLRVLEVDYNAGVLLRKNVLNHFHGGRDMAIDLGRFFRGERVVLERRMVGSSLQKKRKVEESKSSSSPEADPLQSITGSIERCSGKDAMVLSSWYRMEGDKHLPYSSTSWNEWWERRCSLIDPGCEMIKLLLPNPFTKQWDVAGVVYYERNVVDRHLFEGRRVRVTLIRGLRVAPGVNGEVLRRRKWAEVEETEYKGIASVLFNHVVMRSLLCGSEGVAVNCVKSDTAEEFYAKYMGPPLAHGDEDGRCYFRVMGDQRWIIIRGQFLRQCRLLGHEVTTVKQPTDKIDNNATKEDTKKSDPQDKTQLTPLSPSQLNSEETKQNTPSNANQFDDSKEQKNDTTKQLTEESKSNPAKSPDPNNVSNAPKELKTTSVNNPLAPQSTDAAAGKPNDADTSNRQASGSSPRLQPVVCL